MEKEKIEQQLDLIESLVADVRKQYGIEKKSTETDDIERYPNGEPKFDQYGNKLTPSGIREGLDTSFKDIVKLRKQDRDLCNGNRF